MSMKSDDFGARGQPQGRYDLPGGTYEVLESDVPGALNGLTVQRRSMASYRPAYLGEDDTVLACCHHAHEVAKAHGAREVMLEHIVHALARVPEAAAVLLDRGFSVEALKRESAAVISSEIPVDHTTMVAQLRASKDFNTVMHLAAAAASRRDERSMGVRDLLDALLRYDAKARAVRLLRRHAAEAELEEPADPLVEMRGLIDRYTTELRDLRLAVGDLRKEQAGGSLADDRLRSLERQIGALGSDLSGERAQLSERLKGLGDALSAQRNEARTLADRLAPVERLASGGVPAQMQTLIGDRFLSVQKTIDGHRLDLTRLEQALGDRLKGLERLLEQRPAGAAGLDGLAERLGSLERLLEARLGDSSRLETTLIERLRVLEQSLAARPGALPAGLGERMAAIESQVGSMLRGWTSLGERLQGIERSVAGHRAELQSHGSAVSQEVKALSDLLLGGEVPAGADAGLGGAQVEALRRAIESQKADGQRLEASLGERLGAVDRGLAAQRGEVGAVSRALETELEKIRAAMLSLGNAQQTLSSAIDEWRQNNSGDLSVISNRLATLERSVAVGTERPPATVAVAAGVPNGATSALPAAAAAASQVALGSGTSGLLDRVDRALKNRYNSQG